jgi:TPP-dependent 2-oxoacid decarboxylase
MVDIVMNNQGYTQESIHDTKEVKYETTERDL